MFEVIHNQNSMDNFLFSIFLVLIYNNDYNLRSSQIAPQTDK